MDSRVLPAGTYTRRLGKSNLQVCAIGFGCMGLSEFYDPLDEGSAVRAIMAGVEAGIDLFDTADMYGGGSNERLLGNAIRPIRQRLILCTKFGIIRERGQKRLDGSPKYVYQACDASLRRLGTDHIDIYYLHRLDPSTPIAETVGAMSRLVEHGKVRFLGLSKVDAGTLAAADEVFPIAMVQQEYSLLARDVEGEFLDLCRTRDIALVAYSPLCKGLLSGNARARDTLDRNDWRRRDPRFEPANLPQNLAKLERLNEFARKRNCTSSQVALAWLLSQGSNVLPIPGMRSPRHVRENLRALGCALSATDCQALCAQVSGQ